MNCNKCHAPLPEQARFCDQCGESVEPTPTPTPTPPATVHSEQEVATLKGDSIGVIDQRSDRRTGGVSTRQTFGTIEKGGNAVGAIIGREGGHVHVGGEQSYDERHVETGGGAYIQGDVGTSGGDFVGRDKKTVHNVTPDAAGARAAAGARVGGGDLAALFELVYRRIDERPEHLGGEKGELQDMVRWIEAEAEKGEEANPITIRYGLKSLGGLAPDVRDMVVANLFHPVAGVAQAVRAEAKAILCKGGQRAE